MHYVKFVPTGIKWLTEYSTGPKDSQEKEWKLKKKKKKQYPHSGAV